jgi:hypothetical protein
MAHQKVLTYTGRKLVPAKNNERDARSDTGRLIPQTTFVRGQTLGRVTAAGPTQGLLKARSGAKVAASVAAPVPTEGSAGALAAGAYALAYAYRNAQGTTLLSPIASVTIAAAKRISVAAVTPLPAGALSVDWYLSIAPASPLLAFVTNNAGAAFDINALPAPGAAAPPTANTAFTATDGSHVAVGLLVHDTVTDADGNHYRASVVGGLGNPPYDDAMYFYAGEFLEADLVGFDDAALADLGGRRLPGGVIRLP